MRDFTPSSHADWSNMVYHRERSDRRWVEFESSPPMESWWKSAVATVGIVVFLVVIVFFS